VLCNLANELADDFDISILILIKDKISFYHLDHRIKIISVDSYQHTAFTVGRLDKNKNVKDLLEIFECSNIPNTWKLFIMGNGTERKNLELHFLVQKTQMKF